jgi:hypothetical protein
MFLKNVAQGLKKEHCIVPNRFADPVLRAGPDPDPALKMNWIRPKNYAQ